MEPLIQNARALKLPPRSICIIAVQAPSELNTKYIYQLNATDDLLSGIIPLAVNHTIDHKFPQLMNIPLLNIEYAAI